MSGLSRTTDGRMAVSGDMTLETASALLAEGVAALTHDEAIFDLAAVAEIDSSGLAVLFGWLRAAGAQGKTLRIANPPHNLLSLAEVYGVGELLPLS
jgi:phospholipid transport system transporter-binding protein